MLSLGTDAVAHGLTAAWWHNLAPAPPPRLQITIGRDRSIRRAGIDLRRRNIPALDTATVRALSVTSIELTVLEAEDTILIDQALQRKTSMAALNATQLRNMDRRGASQMQKVLEIAASGGRSEAERLLHQILAPMSGWSAQFPLAGFHLDAGFPEFRVGIEVDGWRWHKDSRRNSDDMRRQNLFAAAGWVVLRFDWHRLNNEPGAVVQEVCNVLRARVAA